MKNIMLTSKESLQGVYEFFTEVKKECVTKNINMLLEILPCDDSLRATKGHLIYLNVPHSEKEQEIATVFEWQYDKPIENIEVVTADMPIDDANEKFLKCMEEEWLQCDDPKKLRIGFLNYKLSQCVYFKLSLFKKLPPETHTKYDEWRDSHKSSLPTYIEEIK